MEIFHHSLELIVGLSCDILAVLCVIAQLFQQRKGIILPDYFSSYLNVFKITQL